MWMFLISCYLEIPNQWDTSCISKQRISNRWGCWLSHWEPSFWGFFFAFDFVNIPLKSKRSWKIRPGGCGHDDHFNIETVRPRSTEESTEVWQSLDSGFIQIWAWFWTQSLSLLICKTGITIAYPLQVYYVMIKWCNICRVLTWGMTC